MRRLDARGAALARVVLRDWRAWAPRAGGAPLEAPADRQAWAREPVALGCDGAPEVRFLAPPVRRRASRLTRLMLEVAWQWNASAFGADEYYRPLYANGRIFTVATTRRIAAAIDPETGETLWTWRLNEGIRWQKAPRQFAGRGLAYWTDGREERVIVVTPGSC